MNQNFEKLLNKEWILVGAPKDRNLKRSLFNKKRKITGDEFSLRWGNVLLGDEYGMVYGERLGSLLLVHTPEGKYYFKEYILPNVFKFLKASGGVKICLKY